MCRSIENAEILDNGVIDLGGKMLLPSDVECVTLFLTCSSHENWENLNLWGCYLQDHGVHMLHHGLKNGNATIKTLWLNNNAFTESSSSSISDITISCRVQSLWINGNKYIGEDERLLPIISDPSSMLEELHMESINLSSNAAVKLFTALSDSKKLRVLWIGDNNITDEACDAIIMAMKKNTSLVKLAMYRNPISGECAQLIVQALQHNSTLQHLGLHYNYPEDVKERITSSAEEVNKKRESYDCQVKLKLIFSNW